jgi:hypothetical protein
MKIEEFCHEFHQVDLRLLENCLKVTANCTHGKPSYWVSSILSIFDDYDLDNNNNIIIIIL